MADYTQTHTIMALAALYPQVQVGLVEETEMTDYTNTIMALQALCPQAQVGLADEIFDENFKGVAVLINGRSILVYDLVESTGFEGEGWMAEMVEPDESESEIEEAEDELGAIFTAAKMYRRYI